jgi:hypothetical protein
MTHATCPDCRLRFRPALAAHLSACPSCGRPLQTLGGARAAFGLRLFTPDNAPRPLPEAISVAMPAQQTVKSTNWRATRDR